MILGAHLSVAGGLHKALEAAKCYRFQTVAVFVRNQRQWNAPPLTDEQARTFLTARRKLNINPVLAHGSYLANLAGSPEVRGKSMQAVADEIDRCRRLSIDFYVLHPGSCPSREEGIERVADALRRIIANSAGPLPKILLETTAGQGNCIGGRFEELADLLERLGNADRFGVCLDTCHVFAAGYELRTPSGYQRTMEEFDATVGLRRLAAIHLNDSLGELGGHLDRHTHIGRGRIGKDGFRNMVTDERLSAVPMILETPKGEDAAGRDFDAVNARTLRSLIRRKA